MELRLILFRTEYGEKQTSGELYIYDENNNQHFKCKSLELPWKDNQNRISCIPEEIYAIKKHVSPTFGNCLWVQNVKGRSEILIHAANYVGSNNPKTGKPDLLGCIAPGRDFKDITNDNIKEVIYSNAALGELLDILPDECQFIVTSAKKS